MIIKLLAALMLLCNLTHATSCIIGPDHQPKYLRTIDTIGDSITWQLDGIYLRCLLDDQGLTYDFVGNYIDKFGFKHDGHGGDTTADILKRIGTIPKANSYFILAGVNDGPIPSQITVNNLHDIALKLYLHAPQAVIYISTLLPVNNSSNRHIQEINYLLRTHLNCPNCVIVDLGAYFYALPNWQQYFPDGVHPNLDGYKVITAYLVRYIK